MSQTILIVDDDSQFVAKCRRALESCGYAVRLVSRLDALFDEIDRITPDLVIVGNLAPAIHALETHRVLRQLPEMLGIHILIHGRSRRDLTDPDIRSTMFLRDPIDISKLIKRIDSLIGEPAGARRELAPLSEGPVFLDPRTQALIVNGGEVLLSRIEFRIVYQLAKQIGTTVPRGELTLQVWGKRRTAGSLLNAYVMKLRRKLELNPAGRLQIITEHGAGYRLQFIAPL